MQITIQEAIIHLKNGQPIAFPADTGWVLGCDAANQEAVDRLLALKPANTTEPTSVLIGEIGWLRQYLQQVPEIAWDLVEFAEKPLTVLYSQGRNVAPSLMIPEGILAIRLVREGVAQQMLKRFGRGIAVIPRDAPGQESNVPTLPSTEPVRAVLPTLMRLEVDGQFSFLRKT